MNQHIENPYLQSQNLVDAPNNQSVNQNTHNRILVSNLARKNHEKQIEQ